MRFSYPLGLLGLIAIPIIILIYVIQSKYTEQTVSSTYLWNLSDRFLKKRNPLSGISGIISLILQILTVSAISLAIAHPVFVIPNSAYEYCFVLDTSSSMATVEDGESRLDTAKDEIKHVIKRARGGSTYTLISVSDTAVFVFNDVKSKDSAIDLLESVKPSDTSNDSDDLILAAQEAFDANNALHLYLVTDKKYDKCDNMELISVGSDVENCAIFDLSYSHSQSRITAGANAVSYNSDRDLTIVLSVDGTERERITLSLKAGIVAPIELACDAERYESITLSILEPDGYMLDNSVSAYNLESEASAYSTLIVSESEFFLKAVIDALSDSDVTVVSFEEYEKIDGKYGLYIFDSYSPEVLPDGAVWLINSDKSIPNSGFGVKGVVELAGEDVIEKSRGSASAVRRLLSGVSGESIYITRYVKYSGMYLNFSTLFTHDNNPLIFAGVNGLGNRQVVFGFDFHDSDFPLSVDFIILLGNLLKYTFPDVVDQSTFTVGDEAVINILSSAEAYRAKSPSGKDIYIDTATASCEVLLDEVGTYTFIVTVAGEEISYKVYAAADISESEPQESGGDVAVYGVRAESTSAGEYDPLVLLFIIIAILFVADWGVYCYEKYQLR